MNLDGRIWLLQEIYRIYDGFIAGKPFYCRKRCALCCTRNVTMTTLEAAPMLSAWEHAGNLAWIEKVRAVANDSRLQPVTTINQFAELCARDAPIPEGGEPGETLSCPFLEEDLCTIYPMRPFACRAMVSRIHCGVHQEADMPSLVLSVNNMVMQYLEALDVHRFSGNMIDLLLMMSNALQRRAHFTDMPMHSTARLLVNQPISVLMVPPEHRHQIQPLMQAIQEAQHQVDRDC